MIAEIFSQTAGETEWWHAMNKTCAAAALQICRIFFSKLENNKERQSWR